MQKTAKAIDLECISHFSGKRAKKELHAQKSRNSKILSFVGDISKWSEMLQKRCFLRFIEKKLQFIDIS